MNPAFYGARPSGPRATLGATLLATGQSEKARTCHTAALGLARQTGSIHGQARTLRGLGAVTRSRGDHVQARGYYQQALDLFRERASPMI
jgi:Flp pilus assembly protein TadD